MKNFLLGIFCLYGVGVSSISLYWGLAKDMPALEYAVKVQDHKAEMRHRINVFADGTWILLGNIITVCSLAGMKRSDTPSSKQS